MKKIFIIVLAMAMTILVYGQENTPAVSKMNLGLGFGLDYGGFGARFTYLPVEKLGVFGALGYNLDGAGFNGGLTYRVSPSKNICPTISAMYGYNAVIIIEGAEAYNGTYYGPSIGAGIEWKLGNGKSFWTAELLVPFRSTHFNDDWDAIKDNPNIKVKSDILPIAISVGYHFTF